MDPNDPASFASGRSRFAPKARCVSDKFFWKIGNRQDFFSMKVRHRHFRRRREKKFAVLQAVHIRFELRQLTGADHGFAPDDKRRTDFGVTMLAGVEIEHEINQGPLELGAGAGETNESAPA